MIFTDWCLKSVLIYPCQTEFAIWWICNANSTDCCLKLVLIHMYRCQRESTIWCICNAFLLADVSSRYWYTCISRYWYISQVSIDIFLKLILIPVSTVYIDAKQNLPFIVFVMLFNWLMSQVGNDIHVSMPNRICHLVNL